MKNWYLVSTKPQKDAYAQEQLTNQGYEVYRAVTQRIKTRANKKVQITESLSPVTCLYACKMVLMTGGRFVQREALQEWLDLAPNQQKLKIH